MGLDLGALGGVERAEDVGTERAGRVGARQRHADLKVVTAHRLHVEHGVERGDAEHLRFGEPHGLGDEPEGLLYAVNHEYASRERELGDGDEVALIPPVSGGAFLLSEQPLSLEGRFPGAIL